MWGVAVVREVCRWLAVANACGVDVDEGALVGSVGIPVLYNVSPERAVCGPRGVEGAASVWAVGPLLLSTAALHGHCGPPHAMARDAASLARWVMHGARIDRPAARRRRFEAAVRDVADALAALAPHRAADCSAHAAGLLAYCATIGPPPAGCMPESLRDALSACSSRLPAAPLAEWCIRLGGSQRLVGTTAHRSPAQISRLLILPPQLSPLLSSACSGIRVSDRPRQSSFVTRCSTPPTNSRRRSRWRPQRQWQCCRHQRQ